MLSYKVNMHLSGSNLPYLNTPHNAAHNRAKGALTKNVHDVTRREP